MKYPNIYALFRERVEQYRGRNVFYARQGNGWAGISWDSFGEQAHEFGCALIESGLAKGKAVCILMSNVAAWPVSDIGTIIAGGVSVGLYPTSSAEQCQYIINHSDAEFVLVDTGEQLNKILRIRESLPKVRAIIALDEVAAGMAEGVTSYEEFLRLGRTHSDQCSQLLIDRAESAQPEDIAIIVYTSGTTGQPKGACLSHRYVIKSVEALLETIPLTDSDVSFSYLPYCHVAERISGLYNRLYAGATAYLVDDITKLWDYVIDVQPSILQAYGLTENVCVAFNRPGNLKFGTVGPPMPGCEVKIADDKEILVQSRMMFSGYYKEPEKTAEILRDGWLVTGDLGEMDEDGFLRITGRKKELIITSTGKNIAPSLLENLLKEHQIISHAMVYGDGKSFLVALITLNQAETQEYASNRGIEYSGFADLTRRREIIALVERIVEGVNARVSSTEAIKKFVILGHDLSIESDEVTPTMKIKRCVVAERYKDLFDGMYE